MSNLFSHIRFFVLLFFVLNSCSDGNDASERKVMNEEPTIFVENSTLEDNEYPLDSIMGASGFVDIQSVDSTIVVDLKYASENNFMGVQLYDTLAKAYLQKEVAIRLKKAQYYLDSIHPGYHLLIYDAVRPVSVQVKMWNALDSIPASERGKFVSNPKNRSVHNYGCAVDLTIVDSNGVELDMGAGYDDFRPIAFPEKEIEFLESGELSKEQYKNRRLLRRVMRTSSFYNIPSEWWHFNAFNRNYCKETFPVLLNESGEILNGSN